MNPNPFLCRSPPRARRRSADFLRIPRPPTTSFAYVTMHTLSAHPSPIKAEKISDGDYLKHSWLSALQFLGVGEGVNVIPSTPISSIKKCTVVGEADQDPTGTVGASIHHKVPCESEFRKNMMVGSVLILQKAAIFSPVGSSQYLNVTLRNLVKLFGQGTGPSSWQNCVDNPAQTDNPAQYMAYMSNMIQLMDLTGGQLCCL